jgi:hypothetical protein
MRSLREFCLLSCELFDAFVDNGSRHGRSNSFKLLRHFSCKKQLTQNWYGHRESNGLIKTKHCDGHKRC